MKVSIAVINYGMGNLRSVENALLKIGANPVIVESPAKVGDVDGLLLPGVGALEDCVDGLRASGFDDFVSGWIRENRPFMGVCLGLQALFEVSEERDVRGLCIPGKRRSLPIQAKFQDTAHGVEYREFGPARLAILGQFRLIF